MRLTTAQRRLVFLSSLGGILEFYDFIIYALFAGTLAQVFFPTGNSFTSLLAAFATYAVGYIIRPLGGIVFGHFGDKIGRKKSFTISVLIMAIGTMLIAFIPGYKTIGLAAPVILTLLRMIQGLSIGGEIPGAIAYVSESIPERKGFACGVIFSCLLIGVVAASLIHTLLITCLSPQSVVVWGWRIPFVIGGLFGFMSYAMRLSLNESALYQAVIGRIEAFPIAGLFKYRFKNLIAATCLVSLVASSITLLFLFTPVYVTTILHHHSTDFMWLKIGALLLTSVLCFVVGYFSDKINIKKLVVVICILSFVFIYPIFDLYARHFNFYWLALLGSALMLALIDGTLPSVLGELFPTQYRYSGIAVSYNIGFAVFAGLTPFLSVLLIHHTGATLSPIIILMMTSVFALIGIFMAKRKSLMQCDD